MSLKLYDDTNISAIASAIRSKRGSETLFKVSEMSAGIGALQEDLLYLMQNNDSNHRLTLTDESIKSKATKIKKYTFYEAYIGSLNLQNIEEVGAYAFYNGRVTTLVLPNCITLESYAFYKINKVDDPITTWDLSKVESIGDSCFYESKLTGLLDLPNCKTIGNNSFRSCPITAGVNLPKAETISTEAFNFVSFGVDITLPKIKTIGARAFNHTHSENFTIGAECTSIGSNIFNAGSGVTNLFVLATTPPTLSGRFKGSSGMSGVSHIYVPADSVADYKSANNWNIYESIIEAIPTV